MSSKEGYSTLKFRMLKFQPSSTTEMLLTFVFRTSLNLYFFFGNFFLNERIEQLWMDYF